MVSSRYSSDEETSKLLPKWQHPLENRVSNSFPPLLSPEPGSSPPRKSQVILKRIRCFKWWKGTALVFLVGYTVIAVFLSYWLVKFVLLRQEAYAHSVFAAPLIPNVTLVEGLVPPLDPLSKLKDPTLEDLQEQLDSRLFSLGLPISTLPCSLPTATLSTYLALLSPSPSSSHISRPKTLIALNLYNNQEVFPTLSRSLLSLAFILGPSNIHVSIFENGSTDNTTLAMAHFAAVLTKAVVEHTILSDVAKTEWKKVDRIAQLAVYRNIVLEPMFGSDSGGKNASRAPGRKGMDRLAKADEWDTILFINDVFFCPSDALELLYQRKIQKADAACALDWRATQSWLRWLGWTGVKFYDNWVSRTITGDMFRSRFDVIAETRNGIAELFDQPGSELSRERWAVARPVPVYSCWNGMLALSAEPFVKPDEKGELVKFRSALNSGKKECAASECKTVARDFWVRGFNRWMIVPSVHVTYSQSVYTHPDLIDLSARSLKPIPDTSNIPELIPWDSLKKPKSVVCYSWVRGFHLDLPYRRSREAAF